MTTDAQQAPAAPRREAFIGSYVLESLTLGMYGEPRHALREYVQNAYDAIRRARKNGWLAPDGGQVTVTLDDTKSTLTVEDDGTGISSASAWKILSSVGASNKDRRSQAGFRGIGRLAGIAFCHHLRFITKYFDEVVETTVTFDCERFRRGMDPEQDAGENVQTLLSAAITETHRDLPEADRDRHYTKVVLEDLSLAPEVLKDLEEIRSYLCQTAPVDFDPSWPFATLVREQATATGEPLQTVALTLVHKPAASDPEAEADGDGDGDSDDGADPAATEEDERPPDGALPGTTDVFINIFKPYRAQVSPKGRRASPLTGVRFVVDTAQTPKWWAWYGVTQLLAALDDDEASGLRVRSKNIQIDGTTITDQMFATVRPSYDRFNHWYVGEIHILADGAIPNARRDGFEENTTWLDIKKELQPTFKALAAKPYSASSTRTKLRKFGEKVGTYRDRLAARMAEGEPMTAEEKEALVNEANVLAGRAADYASADLLSAEDAAQVAAYQGVVNSARRRLESVSVADPTQISVRAGADEVLAVVFSVLADMAEPQLYRQMRRAIEQRLRRLGEGGSA